MDLKIPKESQDEIVIWKNLLANPGWQKTINDLKEKVKEADAVINMIGGDGDKRFSQRDIAIVKKNSYLDLMELPEKMISLLSGTGTEKTEEMDAFADEAQIPGEEL